MPLRARMAFRVFPAAFHVQSHLSAAEKRRHSAPEIIIAAATQNVVTRSD